VSLAVALLSIFDLTLAIILPILMVISCAESGRSTRNDECKPRETSNCGAEAYGDDSCRLYEPSADQHETIWPVLQK